MSPTRAPQELIEASINAVRAAMRVCRSVSEASASVRRLTKSDKSPVTVADFASQAVVVHRLRERLGPLRLVGEESATTLRDAEQAAVLAAVTDAARIAWPEATQEAVLEAIDEGCERQPGTSYWTLDPIDGTKGFLRRGQYAVSLAKIDEGQVTMGVLGCPSLGLDPDHALDGGEGVGTIYLGEGGTSRMAAGTPTTEETAPPSWTPLRTPSERPDPVLVTHSVESGHTKADAIERVFDHVGWSWRSVPADSQAKYAMVARGLAHAYVRISSDPTRLEPVWDHAAGVAVAVGAGMVVTDLRGRPLDFSQGVKLRHNHGIICAHPALHAELVQAVIALGLTTVD